jgi:hypothetical protein
VTTEAMTARAATRSRSWVDDNQTYLAGALRRLGAVLAASGEVTPDEPDLDVLAARMDRPPALLALATAFGLSSFERDLVLMCAGPELDADFARPGAGSGSPDPLQPTFGTALSRLPDAHWSALAPSSPLRRWRLVELPPNGSLTRTPLRAAERVVHFLAGVQTLDAEVEGVVDIETEARPVELYPRHLELAERAVRAITTAAPLGSMALIQLVGRGEDARDVAQCVAAGLGFGMAVLQADELPSGAHERERLLRLWEREAVLSSLLLVVDVRSLGDEPHAETSVTRFLDLVASPTLVLTRQPLSRIRRDDVRLFVGTPTVEERLAAWHSVLPDPSPELEVERIAGQFALGSRDVRTVLGELLLREPASAAESGRILWDLCRERSRPRLDHLTERLPTSRVWADLVLPEPQMQTLREVASHARARHRVYGTWGFAQKTGRGLGISALFAGPSGTGKTMAAEGIAELLRLDLNRVDLSRVVSKYIGETERNLGRIFDEAEGAGGVILLFDEADALFGKRTEVRDSHDRYANLEVSYLLQRMEAFDGLAILTTNLKGSLDPAFLRRIRFVVNFPFPDTAARARMWRSVFPAETPTEDLAHDRLARLNVAGGNIRNIAVNAAFAAVETGSPVAMSHLLTAARHEYAKLERPLTESETRGWL